MTFMVERKPRPSRATLPVVIGALYFFVLDVAIVLVQAGLFSPIWAGLATMVVVLLLVLWIRRRRGPRYRRADGVACLLLAWLLGTLPGTAVALTSVAASSTGIPGYATAGWWTSYFWFYAGPVLWGIAASALATVLGPLLIPRPSSHIDAAGGGQ